MARFISLHLTLILILLLSLSSTALANTLASERKEVIANINKSLQKITSDIKGLDKLHGQLAKEQQKLKSMKTGYLTNSDSNCINSMLHIIQNNQRLNDNSKNQLLNQKRLLTNLKPLTYRAQNAMALNNIITKINHNIEQTNKIIGHNNKIRREWRSNLNNVCR